MPTITDIHGTRDVSDAELAHLRAESKADFNARWNALTWQPIAEYAPDQLVIVRNGEDWAVGYYGESAEEMVGEGADLSAMWRDASDPAMEAPMRFQPIEFAHADTAWLTLLCED